MKILGIGNAIIDVICKVDDEFISKNRLTKSMMKLFLQLIKSVSKIQHRFTVYQPHQKQVVLLVELIKIN